MQADFGAQRDFDPSSRLFDLALGGGSILDLGVYPISLAQHLLGRPYRVTTTGTTYPNGADRSAAIQLSYDDGRAASLTCTLASQTPGRAIVVGTEGSIEVVPPSTTPAPSSYDATGRSPSRSSACPPAVATSTRPRRCSAVSPTGSPRARSCRCRTPST